MKNSVTPTKVERSTAQRVENSISVTRLLVALSLFHIGTLGATLAIAVDTEASGTADYKSRPVSMVKNLADG